VKLVSRSVWQPAPRPLRFASEIRSADERQREVGPNEVNLALKLIEGMTAEFDPDKYHDTYTETEDVKKLIEEKAKGRNGKRRHPSLPAATSSTLLPHCRRAWRKRSRGNAALPNVDQIRDHYRGALSRHERQAFMTGVDTT
jgi:non-homologous end joining protein Ku